MDSDQGPPKRKEKGKKKHAEEDAGRRANGKLPPIKELHLPPPSHSLPPSLPPPHTHTRKNAPKMNPNSEDFLPFPLPITEESFPIPPETDESNPPSLTLPLPLPLSQPLPSSPPLPSAPPAEIAKKIPTTTPEEIYKIAQKFKTTPELLLETTAHKDDIIKLVLNLHLALEIFPVRSIYKCRENCNEAFIYTKQDNIKLDKEGTKTLNFSGKHELEIPGESGEKIVMNWLDRKKFGTTERDVDVRRFFVEKGEKAKLDITLVVVVWGALKEASHIGEERIRVLEDWAKRAEQQLMYQQTRIDALEQHFFTLNQFHGFTSPTALSQTLSQFLSYPPNPNFAINNPNSFHFANMNNNNFNTNIPHFPVIPPHPDAAHLNTSPNTTFSTPFPIIPTTTTTTTTSTNPTSPAQSPHSPNSPVLPNHPTSPNLANQPNSQNSAIFTHPTSPNLTNATNLGNNANPRESPSSPPKTPVSQSSKNPPNSSHSENLLISQNSNSKGTNTLYLTRSQISSSSENVTEKGSEKKSVNAKRKKDAQDVTQPKRSAKKTKND